MSIEAEAIGGARGEAEREKSLLHCRVKGFDAWPLDAQQRAYGMAFDQHKHYVAVKLNVGRILGQSEYRLNDIAFDGPKQCVVSMLIHHGILKLWRSGDHQLLLATPYTKSWCLLVIGLA